MAEHRNLYVARVSPAHAEAYIRPLIELLRAASGVEQLDVAGSLQRRVESWER
jgi:hypothetical protein